MFCGGDNTGRSVGTKETFDISYRHRTMCTESHDPYAELRVPTSPEPLLRGLPWEVGAREEPALEEEGSSVTHCVVDVEGSLCIVMTKLEAQLRLVRTRELLDEESRARIEKDILSFLHAIPGKARRRAACVRGMIWGPSFCESYSGGAIGRSTALDSCARR